MRMLTLTLKLFSFCLIFYFVSCLYWYIHAVSISILSIRYDFREIITLFLRFGFFFLVLFSQKRLLCVAEQQLYPKLGSFNEEQMLWGNFRFSFCFGCYNCKSRFLLHRIYFLLRFFLFPLLFFLDNFWFYDISKQFNSFNEIYLYFTVYLSISSIFHGNNAFRKFRFNEFTKLDKTKNFSCFLKKFPNGLSKFLHWTISSSYVFVKVKTLR